MAGCRAVAGGSHPLDTLRAVRGEDGQRTRLSPSHRTPSIGTPDAAHCRFFRSMMAVLHHAECHNERAGHRSGG